MAGIGTTPVTTLDFYYVFWDIEYKHIVRFPDRASQNAYFDGATKTDTMTGCTFQTIEHLSVLRADIPIDDLLALNINYVRWSNSRGRYYYAFVKNVRYASLSSCYVDIELDVYQTFRLDCNIEISFVEREHIAVDTIGANTVPEKLELGKQRIDAQYSKSSINTLGILALGTPTDQDPPLIGEVYSGIINGLMYFYFPPGSFTYFEQWYEGRNFQGEADGVKSIIMIPDEFVDYGGSPPATGGDGDTAITPYATSNWQLPWESDISCSCTQGINGTVSHQNQTAIDFASPGGQNINLFPPYPGEVTVKVTGQNGSTTGLGNYLKIHTDDGYDIFMGHFDSISSNIQVGSRVGMNTVLGRMGTTGNSTGVHLHLDILFNGSPATPSNLFGYPVADWTYPGGANLNRSFAGGVNGESNQQGFYWTVNPSDKAKITYHDINKNLTDLDGYVPKNNKLFTYPYNYMLASNNQGATKEYRYEYMPSGNTFRMNYSCDVSVDPTLFVYPATYNGANSNYDEGLRISGFPQVPIRYGAFENWLAQRGGSAMLQSALSVLGAGASLATGNPIGMVGSMAGLANTIGMWSDAVNMPDTARGNASGAGLIGQQKMNVNYFHICVNNEYARRIDSYFDRYGYATNTVKLPNEQSRPHWNYVKTKELSMKGRIPQDYLARIKKIYNDGVTIWKVPEEVGDFTLNNYE